MPNSGLPKQEQKMYTEDDLNHIIARRVAKIQMDSLEGRISRNESDTNKGFSEMKAAIESLKETLQDSSLNIRKCRDELKKEIDDNFVYEDIFRLEMTAMDKKIDDQWKRITLAVVVASVTIQFAFKLWGG